jgi:hypothetical protein
MREIVLACLCCLISISLRAQLSISAVNTPFTIDFDNAVAGVNYNAFAGSGFSPTPSAGQLDSDAWALTGLSDGDLPFGGTETSGDFARGPSAGGVNTGGIYAFEVSPGDNTLGVQPATNDFNSGTFTLRIQNNSGQMLTAFDITFDVYVLNNGNDQFQIRFFYSSDDVNYTPVSSLDVSTPSAADSPASWEQNIRSTTISGFSIPDGAFFYLRWEGGDLFAFNNDRDEVSIDNISVTGYSTASPGDILITEIMFNPSLTGNDQNEEWFEVYNTTGSTVDIDGWQITDTEDTVTINNGGPLNVGAGQYIVLGYSSSGCGAEDYSYGGNINLSNGGDQIKIIQGPVIIDEVDYNQSGFPAVADGEAIQLDDETNQDATTNDDGANWCVARTACGSDWGTPGSANENCCYFSSVNANKFCDDNGTSANTTDDRYYITLDPDGDGFGSNYSISGDINHPSQSYSGESDLFGAFPSSQTLNLTLTDNTDNTCSIGLSVSPPPHCSYGYGDLFIASQFVNPCGTDGTNEFGIFYTKNALDIADLAYASARNTADLTNIWLGNNYGGSPASIPGYSGSESCGPGVLFCYDWLYPSNPIDASTVNSVISELNTAAGCTVFLPVPSSDIIPANKHVAAFFAAGACSLDNPTLNLNFSSYCSGGTPVEQMYLLLGNAASCGTGGFFQNSAPRIALISDMTGTTTRSFYFSSGSEPYILSLTGQTTGTDCIPPPADILPVELVYFEVEKYKENILLKWGTASEVDNAYFDIERSGDGYSFSPISRIAGAGTTTAPQAYRFTDVSPLPGANYYRLRQVDFGGAAAYSPLRVVHFTPQADQWRLSPTLARQEINLSCADPLENEHTLYILNMLGRPVDSHRLSPGLSQWTLPVSQLPPGTYWLSGLPGSTGSPLRFVKTE